VELEALDHVAVIVRDLPSATRFYEQVLDLHRSPQVATMSPDITPARSFSQRRFVGLKR
jgi:catechol 2,3-dioxygenase-like lactoylglutathione lyase family enzyme